MCRWTCGHTLRDHVRNDKIGERLKVENITEVQESEIEVVWTREETRTRMCRNTDTGDGTKLEK